MVWPGPDCFEWLFPRLSDLILELVVEITFDCVGRSVGIADIDLCGSKLANVEGVVVAAKFIRQVWVSATITHVHLLGFTSELLSYVTVLQPIDIRLHPLHEGLFSLLSPVRVLQSLQDLQRVDDFD